MPRDEFQSKLAELRADVVEPGTDVRHQLDAGLWALESRDEQLARSVIDGDEVINERYLALEADCIDLFALQQPVAIDLRFVASSFKILTDLERIGDLATNFAAYAIPETAESLPDLDLLGIGDEVKRLLGDAVDAYESEDIDACRAIADCDDRIDALCLRASESVVRSLLEREGSGGSPWAIERLLDDVSRLLLTIRDLERVGDHAVNIAARTGYLVDGTTELIY